MADNTETITVSEFNDPKQQINDGVPFPLLLKSTNPPLSSVIDWLNKNRNKIEQQLYQYGAILFRDFGLTTPADFNLFVHAFGYQFQEFIGGGGQRLCVVGQVYTSTESPPSHIIPFHHELAYLTHYPSKLAFYCDVPASSDGETPVLLSSKLLLRIAAAEPRFLENLKTKKAKYLRVLSSARDPSFRPDYQRGWEDIFETHDRAEAESRAYLTGTETVEWLENGAMRVMSVAFDPVKEHPVTGKLTWFNSVVLLHPCIYGSSRKDKPWSSLYGDGEELEEESLLNIYHIMQEEGVALKWHKGDVLLIDNYGTLHSRNPFVPPRRILVSMFK